ncbi:MAG: RagB/SusD family nutrient uptake outer membrane protein [Bacteroidales bacterium]|nr:RagB/SusD family nutrient uptake outer membrane protein [Bacteroidales bacterium]
MKNIVKISLASVIALLAFTACIKEFTPQTSYATNDQVSNAPGSFNLFVDALTSTLAGDFTYGGADNKYPFDFGYPAFFLQRDLMGQDIVYPYQNWYTYWYSIRTLGPTTAISQVPWTYYYGWIKGCNDVINLAGPEPEDSKKPGAGQAYAMRAMFYMDLARMFAPKPYTVDKNAVTVPIVNETSDVSTLTNNPRATNEKMWEFILSDLDKAEELLDGYARTGVYVMDQSVVFGLKARAYLETGAWENAVTYAKKAQAGYTIMDEDAYTNPDTGFNTPNSSWMFGLTYKSDDPVILINDADSSWGSMMCIEINPTVSGCGYAANYGQPFLIDRHLYETIPATDFRKKCYVDFAIDDLPDDDAKIAALNPYSAAGHGDWILNTGTVTEDYNKVGGLELKFRTAGGDAGRDNQYIGFVVAVPLMRVEEMYLIEAEAAGRLKEADGIALLTTFAKTRDASYVYGTHNEAYGNKTTSAFINEIWWQRRVEFWGEGFATFDIKRLQKGIIRNYAGTNHAAEYRWNMDTTPTWMNSCIVQTETNYNSACTNNPEPIPPTGDSPIATSF